MPEDGHRGDHLDHSCATGAAQAPTGNGRPSLAQQACPAAITRSGINPQGTAYYDIGALGPPGDSTPGGAAVSCWLFTAFLGNSGFCMKSEGDGVWDNDPLLDRFHWSWEMDDVQVPGTATSGIVMSGDPAVGTFGSCTYNLPCGGAPTACGTGFGQHDGFWINIDADAPDGSTNTGVSCFSGPAAGTTCYWFGGYPGNPWGGFWMKMVADGSCDGAVPTITACQNAPTALQDCQSTLSTVGLPSASMPTPFTIHIGGLNARVNGVAFYGLSGAANVTWSPQSTLCVKSPTQPLFRVAGASGNTTGTIGNCDGHYSFDFNAVIRGSVAGMLGTPMAAGQRVDLQGWQRDALSTKTTNMTDAITFVVGP